MLKIPFHGTIKLQRSDLTMSDVFGIWLEMQIQIERILRKRMITNLATNLLDAIKDRRQIVFNNDITICAVFLDPRFRAEIVRHKSLSDEETAIDKLVLLWEQLKKIENKNSSGQNDLSSETVVNLDSSHDSLDDPNMLNEYLKRGMPDNSTNDCENMSSNFANNECDIRSLLETFNPEWMAANESVLNYWENAKDTHPILYKLAMAVYAVPPTEVQIERDFSKLEHILTSRRQRLAPEMLESILMLHLNKDLFYVIKEEELNNIKI